VLIAGEETKESLSTWPREAAARLGARERETGVGKKEEGSGRKGKQTAKKKNARAKICSVNSAVEGNLRRAPSDA
jgi:hypothetical protein